MSMWANRNVRLLLLLQGALKMSCHLQLYRNVKSGHARKYLNIFVSGPLLSSTFQLK